jgi:acetolactate synthase-1/2/3 large subunit
MIQVDIDEEVLGMNKPAEISILSDVKLFLEHLSVKLEKLGPEINLESRRQRLDKLVKDRDKDRSKLDEKLSDMERPMSPAHVSKICDELFEDDAVVVFDGGNTAVWGHFFHLVKVPNTQLGTHHFGMLGAGLGQALGAAVARPAKQVYCIIGDGAFGFHPQEVETAIRNKLKVIFIVCCDKQWGMVKINQQFALKPMKTMIKKSLSPEETINTDLNEIEFDKMAIAMGAHGERVDSPEELRGAIERSLASEKCAVIHVDVDPVKHMWAPGLLHFKAMHQEPGG